MGMNRCHLQQSARSGVLWSAQGHALPLQTDAAMRFANTAEAMPGGHLLRPTAMSTFCKAFNAQ